MLVVHGPRTGPDLCCTQLYSSTLSTPLHLLLSTSSAPSFSLAVPSLSLFFAGSSCSCFVTHPDEIDRNFAAPFARLLYLSHALIRPRVPFQRRLIPRLAVSSRRDERSVDIQFVVRRKWREVVRHDFDMIFNRYVVVCYFLQKMMSE